MPDLVIPNTFDAFMSGQQARQEAETQKKQKRFGELVGQMATTQDRAPIFQQAAAIDPINAMKASEYFGQQDQKLKQEQALMDQQSAKTSLYKVNAIRTAPDQAKVALYAQVAPDHYQQVVQMLGRDPTPQEINQTIDQSAAELYARAGIEPPKPDVVSAETRYKTDSQKEEAALRLKAEQARIDQQQSFTAEQNRLNRDAQAQNNADRTKATNSKATDTERAAAGYYDRMQKAEGLLGNYAPSMKDYFGFNKNITGGAVSSSIGNSMISPDGQKYYQAASDWVRSKLRKESGAVIGPQEMAQEIRTYFPVPGDTQDVIAQKALARKTATDAMKGMAGPASQPQAGQIIKHASGATIEILP